MKSTSCYSAAKSEQSLRETANSWPDHASQECVKHFKERRLAAHLSLIHSANTWHPPNVTDHSSQPSRRNCVHVSEEIECHVTTTTGHCIPAVCVTSILPSSVSPGKPHAFPTCPVAWKPMAVMKAQGTAAHAFGESTAAELTASSQSRLMLVIISRIVGE